MDPRAITTDRPLSSPPRELNLASLPSLDPQDDPQRFIVSKDETPEGIAEELESSPSLAHSHDKARNQPTVAEAHHLSGTPLFLLTEEECLQYKEWLALAKSSQLTDEERLALIDTIQHATIKLKLLCDIAKGSLGVKAHIRLKAAHTIQTLLDGIKTLEGTDRDTLKLYMASKNEAYYAIATDPTLEEGDILLSALERIGDYTLKEQALRYFAENKDLDESFKQEAFVAIAKNQEHEDYFRYWAATLILEDHTRDLILYDIAVTDNGHVSESIILEAAERIQNDDTKDNALQSIALNGELGSACGLDALESMKNTEKKEATCIQIGMDERFDPEYRLEAAKYIQDETKKEEVLIAFIGWDTPIYGYNLRLKLAACEAMTPSVKYPNLRQDILKKFFSQNLEPDETGQAITLNSQCHWVVSFFEDTLKSSYADTDMQTQAILLKGFVHYLGAFCTHIPLEKLTTLIQNLYEASLDEAIKKDFVYAILQCGTLENPQHKLAIYTCTLTLALPAEKVSHDTLHDLMDQVLSKAGCSQELCIAAIHYFKGMMRVAPSVREAMVYCMIDNTHLDQDFRKNIVTKLSTLDAEEKQKLLRAIDIGEDTKRFKRMKVTYDDE